MSRRWLSLAQDVASRCESIATARPDWPCRAGCDDCCRSLANVPELTEEEWVLLRTALDRLDAPARAAVGLSVERRRALGSARPVTCPLLDQERGLCRVYEARPIACRTYGFYADRDGVLGCARIAERAARDGDLVWGNHDAVMREAGRMGPRKSLLEWLDEDRE